MSPRESTPELSDAFSRFAEQQSTLLQRVVENPNALRSELPKIRIEPFNGNYKNWPAFKDLFVSAIDSKTDLTNIQKFHYLSSLLTDDAAKLIKHMQVSETSYSAAWERLKERYDRPRHIVTSYIETFMSINAFRDEDAIGLRRISDVANEVVRGMEAIGRTSRDSWLIYLLNNKIDPDTRRKWFEISRDDDDPTVETFLRFLEQRCEELELGKRRKQTESKQRTTFTVAVNNDKCCYKCGSGDHILMKCSQFHSLSMEKRRSFVKEKNLCFNCLGKGHSSVDCKSSNRCRTCNRKHHTLTHVNSNVSSDNAIRSNSSKVTPENSLPVALNSVSEYYSSERRTTGRFSHILPTAIINVRDHQGNMVSCRILLDSASELSYITENCFKRLGLRRFASKVALSGISSIKADTTNGHGHILIKSRISDDTVGVQVHVLNKITSLIPRFSLDPSMRSRFDNIALADPAFDQPSEIDILLGAGYIWDIFTMEKIRDAQGRTIAISSIFGWVVTSSFPSFPQSRTTSMVTLIDIDRSLRAFWEVEEVAGKATEDILNTEADEHFQRTHRRNVDGRYRVQLPFIEENVKFGDTCHGALTRYHAIEKRLQRDPVLRDQYVKFMRDYENLGHMREVKEHEIDINDGRIFYLPHHPIIGKKLRVVFDGSFCDTNGTSLNSKLNVGSPIQRNLFSVCLNFRLYEFVFSADIVKMFRQVWIDEKHRNFQRILWREDPGESIKHYQLCTVTYGTTSAPFLAVSVLEQIARDYRQDYPQASRIISEDFYVDDVLTGASTESDLLDYRNELVQVFSLCGLELDKWMSNSDMITSGQMVSENIELMGRHDTESKVLGIYWNPRDDYVCYKVKMDESKQATKRRILSDASRIFDPLGLVSPVTVKFKILFQDLWLQNLSWDDPLPSYVAEAWYKYRQDLHRLEEFQLRRFVPNEGELHLHGFCDASTKAYSAVVYCRYEDTNGQINVSIMASKTRVTPLKQISLPRLELCGALLLTRLMKSIADSLPRRKLNLHAWCDSTVVLSWLSMQPVKLKTFVANRTSEILETLPRHVWHHVRTKQNPADCASRGMMAEQLLNFELWWKGPTWLSESNCMGTLRIHSFEQRAEEVQNEVKPTTTTLVSCASGTYNPFQNLTQRTSSWTRFIRATAYVLRFVAAIRTKHRHKGLQLTFEEIQAAKIRCLITAQECFKDEIRCLKGNEPLPTKSTIRKLSPFIDENGVLRVGGRIGNSELPEDIRHPIILPKDCQITKMIIREEHVRNLHPGVSSMFVILRQRYWIIGARNMIRKMTHDCLKCFRHSRRNTEQRMADLPSVRVRRAFLFENTGCDYAGPFTLKLYKGRNSKTSKGYVCIFVCMVTSAIHIELVTDLSTDAFLSALRIFMSRRGKCRNIFSDNGKNFVGAKRKLDEMYEQLQSEEHNGAVLAALANEGISWKFFPPYSSLGRHLGVSSKIGQTPS